jgi:hypothetical protein
VSKRAGCAFATVAACRAYERSVTAATARITLQAMDTL